MALPAYEFHLNESVVPRQVAVGCFDGTTPSLAMATGNDRVVVYTPAPQGMHQTSGRSGIGSSSTARSTDNSTDSFKQGRIRTFNEGSRITALCTTPFIASETAVSTGVGPAASGSLAPPTSIARDALIIGTGSHVHAYDVERNSDLFFANMPEGVSCLKSGQLPNGTRIVLAGGDCTLQGFGEAGNELFWTVTGDRVTSLCYQHPSLNSMSIASGQITGQTPKTNDGDDATSASKATSGDDSKFNMLVGTRDYAIRLYQQEQLMWETLEGDVVTCLVPLASNSFAYSLADGSLGVYVDFKRQWHIKSTKIPIDLAAYDIDGDGQLELIVGWSNGKIEARNIKTGNVVFRDKLVAPPNGFSAAGQTTEVIEDDYVVSATVGVGVGEGTTSVAGGGVAHSIAALVIGNLNGSATPQLIVVTTSGFVRGYTTPDLKSVRDAMESQRLQDELRQLLSERAALLQELNRLEFFRSKHTSGMANGQLTHDDNTTVIPTNTRLVLELVPDPNAGAVMLNLGVNNGMFIKALTIFSNVVYRSGGYSVVYTEPSSVVAVPVVVPKLVPVDLEVSCVVGRRGSSLNHVFELCRPLARFAMLRVVPLSTLPPTTSPTGRRGYVRFVAAGERTNRLSLWLENSFVCDRAVLAATTTVTGTPNSATSTLAIGAIHVASKASVAISMGEEGPGVVKISTDDIELAADLVQDLMSWFGLADCDCVCDFPTVFNQLEKLMDEVGAYNATRNRISVDLAAAALDIKTLTVLTEDARLLGNYDDVITHITTLHDTNLQLIDDYSKRAQNHEALLKCLKQVHDIIQQAARLRSGSARTNVVNLCRQAVKNNDKGALLKAIAYGGQGVSSVM